MEYSENCIESLLGDFVEYHHFSSVPQMLNAVDDIKALHKEDNCSTCVPSSELSHAISDIRSEVFSYKESSVSGDFKSCKNIRRKSVCVAQRLDYSSDSSYLTDSEEEDLHYSKSHCKDVSNNVDRNLNSSNDDLFCSEFNSKLMLPSDELAEEDAKGETDTDEDSPIFIRRNKKVVVNSESESESSSEETDGSDESGRSVSSNKHESKADWSDSDGDEDVFNASSDEEFYSAESGESYESDSFIVKETHHSKPRLKKKSEGIYKTPKCPINDILERVSSTKAAPGTPAYKRCFNKNRDEAVKKLFMLYNETIFSNELPDIGITWNKRLTKTAGFCYLTRSLGKRGARIELSDKVIDTPERIRDTLLHEVCHAAAWIFDNQKGHGFAWKRWANKSKKVHPNLPIVSTCHTYEINTKYRYQCDGCGKTFGRHSKSIDETRHRCAACGGTPTLISNSNAKTITPAQSMYKQFMKENFACVKKSNPTYSLGEVMKEIGEKFREFKLNSEKGEVNVDQTNQTMFTENE